MKSLHDSRKSMAATRLSPIWFARLGTTLGEWMAVADESGLIELSYQDGEDPRLPDPTWIEDAECFGQLHRALSAYAAGRGPLPDWNLGHLQATPFQRRVWRELQRIPYGEVRSYGDVARSLGQPGASRAVGTACGRNPIPLFIPCHRVIGSGGALGGFSCGLDVKRRLLRLEGAIVKGLREPEVSKSAQ